MNASLVERNLIDEQVQSLLAVVDELRLEVRELQLENAELRRQVSELRCDVGFGNGNRRLSACRSPQTLSPDLRLPWRATNRRRAAESSAEEHLRHKFVGASVAGKVPPATAHAPHD